MEETRLKEPDLPQPTVLPNNLILHLLPIRRMVVVMVIGVGVVAVVEGGVVDFVLPYCSSTLVTININKAIGILLHLSSLQFRCHYSLRFLRCLPSRRLRLPTAFQCHRRNGLFFFTRHGLLPSTPACQQPQRIPHPSSTFSPCDHLSTQIGIWTRARRLT